MENSHFIKIVKRNKSNFIFLNGVFLVFLAIVVYGGRQIYIIERAALSERAASELEHDKKDVRDFFSSCASDLAFISDMPEIPKALSDKADSRGRDALEKTLRAFMRVHPSYRKFTIVDRLGGRMVVSADISVGASEFLKSGDSGRLVESLGKGNRIYVAPAGLHSVKDVSGVEIPTTALLKPVYGEDGSPVGIICMEVSLGPLIGRLSRDTFIQNNEGLVWALSDDGSVKTVRGYGRWDREGVEKVSDTESVSHFQVEYLPGYRMNMIKVYSYSTFKSSMKKLETAAVVVFAVFFVFVLGFSYYNVDNFRKLALAQKAIIYSLANLSEWRDPETGSHLERTRNFSVLLARTLAKTRKYEKIITEDFLEDLYDSVPLHDIGKVGIRDDILLKTAGLSRGEFDSMKEHVVIGRDVIQDIIDRFGITSSFLMMSRNICYHHHEKFDGSGYPEGLRGEAIPLEARIFAVCDVYDALRSKRPYKEGLSHERALEIIRADSGRHFDPDVIDALLECGDEFYEIFDSYKLFDDTYGKTMHLRSKDSMKVEWTEELSVGDERIDAQHRQFFGRINSLFEATLRGEAKSEVENEMAFLCDYAARHFKIEEEMMDKFAYPDLAFHKEMHERFLAFLDELRLELNKTGLTSALVLNINSKLVNWLIGHIMSEDKKVGDYIRSL